MQKVKWYRNPPEKDQDKPQGTGELYSLAVLQPESIAVIIDAQGNFHEKPISLVRVDMDKTVPTPAATKPAPVKPVAKPVKKG